MTSRREFLKVAALAGLPALPVAADGPGGPLPHTDLHRVLADSRHPEAHALAARFAHTAAVRLLEADDLTRLWRHELGPAWRQRPPAIAGLTTAPVLFCLEQLGLGDGLRVVFHAEHRINADHSVAHALLRGAREADLSAEDLTRAGPLWPARIATAMTRHRAFARPHRAGPSESGLAPAVPAGARLLTSWIIAPV